MTTKIVTVTVNMRENNDPQGSIVSSTQVDGTTEDEGTTVVVPIGYLPDVPNAFPADITVSVHEPPTEHTSATFGSRTDDTNAGTSTIVFSALG